MLFFLSLSLCTASSVVKWIHALIHDQRQDYLSLPSGSSIRLADQIRIQGKEDQGFPHLLSPSSFIIILSPHLEAKQSLRANEWESNRVRQELVSVLFFLSAFLSFSLSSIQVMSVYRKVCLSFVEMKRRRDRRKRRSWRQVCEENAIISLWTFVRIFPFGFLWMSLLWLTKVPEAIEDTVETLRGNDNQVLGRKKKEERRGKRGDQKCDCVCFSPGSL